MVVTRTLESNGTMQYDYYLSNAPKETSLDELARVVKAAIALKTALSEPRARPDWLIMRSVPGWAGSIIKYSRLLPCGF